MGKDVRSSHSRTSSATLFGCIDRGAYDEALRLLASTNYDADDGLAVARAEVALYLDRIDECAELVRTAAPASTSEIFRVCLIRAELAFWGGALDDAVAQLDGLIASLELVDGEIHLELRAKVLRARCEMRRAQYAKATELLREPGRFARAASNGYMRAFVAYCLGWIALKTGDLAAAHAQLADAIDRFDAAGARRWGGYSRALRSIVHADERDYALAIADCDAASTVSFELGVWRDAISAEHNAARTLMLAGDVRGAIARLTRLAQDGRFSKNGYAEIAALYLLGLGLVLARDPESASRIGTEVEQLASLVETEVLPFDGKLIAAWAAAAGGERSAVANLCSLAITARSIDASRLVDARVLLADCLSESEPAVAGSLLAIVEGMPELADQQVTRLVLERCWRRLERGLIVVSRDGEFRLHPTPDAQDFEKAVEQAGRFLVVAAFLASRGKQSAMARKLNKSRAYIHYRIKELRKTAPHLFAVLADAARHAEPSWKKHLADVDDQPKRRKVSDPSDRGAAVPAPALAAAGKRGRNEGRKAEAGGKRKGRETRRAKE